MKLPRQIIRPRPLLRACVWIFVCLLFNGGMTQAATKAPDLDGDGIPNIVDPDIDNDGIPNALDKNVDGGIAKSGPYKGKYIGDHLDNDNPAEHDIDGDTLADDSLADKDVDGDGKLDDDADEMDIDGDGRADDALSEKDIDGDGKNDDELTEDDIDGDGLDDDDPTEMDIDGDTLTNGTTAEIDTDGDGVLDSDPAEMDDDGDGRDDGDDDDDDNDGISDGHDTDHHDEPGEGESSDTLTRLAAAPSNATASMELRTKPSGRIRLEIELNNVTAGTYELLVAGVSHASITVTGSEGKFQFETIPDDEGELALDFEIYGQPLLIKKNGVDYFSGTAPAAGGGGEGASASADLIPTNAAPSNSEGEVKVSVALNGDVTVVIDVQDLGIGNYSLKVGGVTQAALPVTQDGSHTKGRLKFASNPTGDQLQLSFEISGQTVTIEKQGTVFMSAVGPTP